ncbi:flagellar biosynthetic protein FliR [Myxococcota bacterium]|nr:flagellar biosynthetic protein FliR [Myxococcota bacterium]MBU1535814.1 flagellar biosynthetic protein FliR [Myxococcota bacterium]
MWLQWLEQIAPAGLDADFSLLVFARIAPLGALPFFAPRGNLMVRTAIVLALTLFFSTSLPTQAQNTLFWPSVVSEALLGMVLWGLVAILFSVFSAAGSYAGRFRGGDDPQSSFDDQSSMGALFNLLAIVMFFASGAHLLFIRGLGSLFTLLPPGSLIHSTLHPGMVLYPLIHAVTVLFTSIFLMTLPLIATMLMTDIAVGVLSRFYPSMNAYFLVMPFKAFLFSVVLLLFVPVIPIFFSHIFQLIMRFVTTLQL